MEGNLMPRFGQYTRLERSENLSHVHPEIPWEQAQIHRAAGRAENTCLFEHP
jgi:hypothetical protein